MKRLSFPTRPIVNGRKKCIDCNLFKELFEFYRSRFHPEKSTRACCRVCANARSRISKNKAIARNYHAGDSKLYIDVYHPKPHKDLTKLWKGQKGIVIPLAMKFRSEVFRGVYEC